MGVLLSQRLHYRGVYDIIRSIQILQDLVPGHQSWTKIGPMSLYYSQVLDTKGQALANSALLLKPACRAWPVLWRCLTPRAWQFSDRLDAVGVEDDEYLQRLCLALELRATNNDVFHGEIPLEEDLRFEVNRYFGEVVSGELFRSLDL